MHFLLSTLSFRRFCSSLIPLIGRIHIAHISYSSPSYLHYLSTYSSTNPLTVILPHFFIVKYAIMIATIHINFIINFISEPLSSKAQISLRFRFSKSIIHAFVFSFTQGTTNTTSNSSTDNTKLELWHDILLMLNDHILLKKLINTFKN